MTFPTTDVYVDAEKVDAALIERLTIRYGRTRPTEFVQPSSCVFTLLADHPVANLFLGLDVSVETTSGATTYERFTGKVVALRTGKYTIDVECTSSGLGRLARWPVADYLFDTIRLGCGDEIAQLFAVNGITGAGSPLAFEYDPGEVRILDGYRVPGGTALDVAQVIAGYDAAGILWERTDGTVVYSDSSARDYPTASEGTLYLQTDASYGPPCILDDWIAEQSLSDLVNDVVITYGRTGRTVALRDDTSIAEWGKFSYYDELPTDDVSYAQLRASRLVANYRDPALTVSPLSVELSIPSAPVASLLSACVNTIVEWLPGPPPIPEMPDACYLEGYTETITQTSHRLDLYLSDVRLTRTPQTWTELSPTLAWNAVSPATRSWYELLANPL